MQALVSYIHINPAEVIRRELGAYRKVSQCGQYPERYQSVGLRIYFVMAVHGDVFRIEGRQAFSQTMQSHEDFNVRVCIRIFIIIPQYIAQGIYRFVINGLQLFGNLCVRTKPSVNGRQTPAA